MAEGIYSWSKTPAENDDADENINWLEGQDPSTVNNSSRQGMSEEAGFRDDLGAVALSTGDGITYVVSSANITGTPDHKTITALAVGNVLWFRPNATNAGDVGATLNVNSLGTVPLRILSGVELEAGQIVANQVIGVFYDGTQWLVVGAGAGTIAFNQLSNDVKGQLTKVGYVRPQFEKDTPAGWLICDGRTNILINDFPALHELWGTRYGTDDAGATTFGLPNISGKAIRGVDLLGTTDPDAAIRTPAPGPDTPTPGPQEPGSTQSDEFASHSHTTSESPHTHAITDTGHDHTITDAGHTHPFTANVGVAGRNRQFGADQFDANPGQSANVTSPDTTGIIIDSSVTGIGIDAQSTGLAVDVAGGNETRMDNIYAYWIVLADAALAADSGGPFVVIIDGDGPPSDLNDGNNGDFYVDNTNTIWYGPKGEVTSDVWPTPGVDIKGADGAIGPAGPRGLSGLPYSFSTDIAMPTADGQLNIGTIRFNNATMNSVTQIAVSDILDDGTGTTDVGVLLNTFDDSTNTPPARMSVFDVDVLGKFLSVSLDSIAVIPGLTDSTVYNVTFVDSAAPIGDGDKINLTQSTAGDQGDQGFTGPPGINPGVVQKFDDGFANNQDPGIGHFTMDNAVTPTEIYVDDLNDASASIRAWIDTWPSSTTINDKGYLLIKDQALPDTIFRLCTVTATNPGTGGDTTYTKVTVVLESGAGTFVDENDMTLEFSKTGDVGSASGDVQGPNAGVVDDEVAVYNSTTGKIIKGSAGTLYTDLGLKSTYDANTILKADADNTPVALPVAEERLLGRITAGVITALTKTQVDTFLGLADLAFLNTVGTTEIDNAAVTNAKLANMVTNTIKGRDTAGTGAPEDITLDNLSDMLHTEAATPALRVPQLGTDQAFNAGQRKQITDLPASATVYDWAANNLTDSNDFSLGTFAEGRTLNIPPDQFITHEAQAGEITGITGAGGSLIFGAGWEFPAATAPTIGADTQFTLYYRSFSLDGATMVNRITELQGWG